MRPGSYLAIGASLVVALALVVAFVVDDTKGAATYFAIFGGVAIAIVVIVGTLRAEGRGRP